jgi:hypothetical protein
VERGRTVKEHQESDADNGIEFASDFVSTQVRFISLKLQSVALCYRSKMLDRSMAAVKRDNGTTFLCCSDRQIAKTAAEVEYLASKVGSAATSNGLS